MQESAVKAPSRGVTRHLQIVPPHIKHYPTHCAELQHFPDVYGNQDQDCVSEIENAIMNTDVGCKWLKITTNVDSNCLTTSVLVRSLFRIADIAFFY